MRMATMLLATAVLKVRVPRRAGEQASGAIKQSCPSPDSASLPADALGIEDGATCNSFLYPRKQTPLSPQRPHPGPWNSYKTQFLLGGQLSRESDDVHRPLNFPR